MRDEREDDRRGDSKARDSHANNASPNGHSPVLNLSKAGNDHGSLGDHSERSEAPSPEHSMRDDDEMSYGNENTSDVEDNKDKDDGKTFHFKL